MYLCKKTLFGREMTFEELVTSEKARFKGFKFKSARKNKEMRRFHVDYSRNVGMVSSILFFPDGPHAIRLPPTLLARLKSPSTNEQSNPFSQFFTHFFRVTQLIPVQRRPIVPLVLPFLRKFGQQIGPVTPAKSAPFGYIRRVLGSAWSVDSGDH